MFDDVVVNDSPICRVLEVGWYQSLMPRTVKFSEAESDCGVQFGGARLVVLCAVPATTVLHRTLKDNNIKLLLVYLLVYINTFL